MKAGDRIVWTNDELGFAKYLAAETLDSCLPAHGISSIAKGVAVYRRFYDRQAEKVHGVVAIRLAVAAP